MDKNRKMAQYNLKIPTEVILLKAIYTAG